LELKFSTSCVNVGFEALITCG